jgi:hypothetical protein
MKHWVLFALLLAGVSAGTLADAPPDRPALFLGGYQVLAADFHLHSSMWSSGTLTPWGLVLEAQRQRLDVIGVTGHNETFDAKIARGFARLVDNGPLVLVGEEVISKTQDLIAVGIESTVSPWLPLVDQIAEVHRQGGVAIAPHPGREYWTAYAPAMGLIDGAEACHPMIWEMAGRADEAADFARRTTATPIGSSDFHYSGRPGSCRTFVFVRAVTEAGVLDAIRAHRTVVYGYGGRAFGDPALVHLADGAGLRERAQTFTGSDGGLLDWISRLTAAAGLLGIALLTRAPSLRALSGRG